DLIPLQKLRHPISDQERDDERGQDRIDGPERDVTKDVQKRVGGVERIQKVIKHQEFPSAPSPASTRSIFIPLDPLIKRQSPSFIVSRKNLWADSRSGWTKTAAIPACLAPSAVFSARSPTVIRRSIPSCAARFPISRWAASAEPPSSSMSPRRAILRLEAPSGR